MSGKKRLPKCIGNYDVGDDICDGDPRADDEHDKLPCVFRDRCAALRKHCSVSEQLLTIHIKTKRVKDKDGEHRTYAFSKGDDETFSESLAKWADRWGIKNGRVTRTEPRKVKKPKTGPAKQRTKQARPVKPPSADARRKAREALAVSAEQSLKDAYGEVTWFTKCLVDNTLREFVSRPTEAEIGELFLVDRLGKSRYAAVYCRAAHGKKIAVASIYPHTRLGTCQVRFPVGPDAFTEAHVKRLSLIAINDGRFKSRSGKLDREGTSIATEAIAALIERGSLQLPPDS